MMLSKLHLLCLDATKSANVLSSYISSKDAYMLIYARSEVSQSQPTSKKSSNATSIPETTAPPQRALRVVEELNNEHEKRCEEYTVK